MATQNHPVATPFVLKTLSVLFKRAGVVDAEDFSDHVGEFTLTPTAGTASWTSGNGKTIQRAAVATWAATLGLVQDLDPSGLLRWLLAHEGENAELLVTFADGTDPCRVDVTLSPALFGAAADGSIGTASVTLAVSGRPVWAAGTAFTE